MYIKIKKMLIMAVCAVIAVNLSSCGIIKAAIKNITTDASSSDTATNNIHVYSIPPSSEYSSDFTSSETSSTASSAVSSKSAESKASSKPTVAAWKYAYWGFIRNNEYDYPGTGFALVNINGDDIPELFIDTFFTAGGARLCTYSGGKVYDIYLCSYGFSYIPGKNKFYEAGGRMDEYYDNIFTIKNGSFKRIYSGTYGIPVNSEVQFDENGEPIYEYYEVQFDENGEPIYEYYWEETKVDSADEYNEKLNSVYDLSKSVEPTEFYHYDTIYEEIYSY